MAVCDSEIVNRAQPGTCLADREYRKPDGMASADQRVHSRKRDCNLESRLREETKIKAVSLFKREPEARGIPQASQRAAIADRHDAEWH